MKSKYRVLSGRNSSEVFESIEMSFHFIAAGVDVFVIAPRVLEIFLWDYSNTRLFWFNSLKIYHLFYGHIT